jgi:hypothetical protein
MFVLLTLQSPAQDTSEIDIAGTWKVVNIIELAAIPKDQDKTVEMYKEAFLKSTFVFQADHYFSFDFDIEKMRVQNGRWKFNTDTKSYIIQDWKDENSNRKLMEIKVRRDGDKILFLPAGPYFALEMEKQF